MKGTAHTRPSEGIEAIDLCNEEAATKLIQEFKPDCMQDLSIFSEISH